MRGDDDADSSTPLSAARDGDGSPTIDAAAVAAVASILVAPEAMASRRDSATAGFGFVGIGGTTSGGGIATGESRVSTGGGEERHCAS